LNSKKPVETIDKLKLLFDDFEKNSIENDEHGDVFDVLVELMFG